MPSSSSYLKKRIASFGYAFNGIKQLIKTEQNAQIHFSAAIIAISLGFYLDLSTTEWILIILCITGVLAAEGMNSAIEEIANFIHPEKHEKMKIIKDLAAGSVLMISLGAAITGLLIFIPKILLEW